MPDPVRLPVDLTPLVLEGHVLDVLRSLPVDSIQTVVTSPPYWGLRAYRTEGQVWGGNSDGNHEWGPEIPREARGNVSPPGQTAEDRAAHVARRNSGTAGQFCVSNHAHEWHPTDPRRPRSAEDVKNPNSLQAGSQGTLYEAQGGLSCSTCGAWKGELGLEPTPELYVSHLADVFDEVRRVLRPDGTLWLNLGDTYAGGSPVRTDALRKFQRAGDGDYIPWGEEGNQARPAVPGLRGKNLVGIPWRVAFELQRRGWYLRSDVIWSKPNPMPESVTDRPTRSHEYVFLLAKEARYYYDADAVRNPLQASTEERMNYPASYNHNATAHDPFKSQAAPGFGYARSTLRELADGYDGQATKPYEGTGAQDPSATKARIIEGARARLEAGLVAGANLKSVWQIATRPYPEAHFATYPEEIPERCIKLGTSEKGCCERCGAPVERTTVTTVVPMRATSDRDTQASACRKEQPFARGWQQKGNNMAAVSETTGWEPSCECHFTDSESMGGFGLFRSEPCLVLDPFAGSGTTLHVARRLGRRSIGIELNPQYVQLARRRSGADVPSLERFHEPEPGTTEVPEP